MLLRLLLFIYLNLFLFLGLAQEIPKDMRVTLADTTANHYICLSSLDNPNSIGLVRTSKSHYQIVSWEVSIPNIFISVKNNNVHQINKGDILHCRITSSLPKCANEGYDYIGLGEYLMTNPNTIIHFCEITDNSVKYLHNSKLGLSIKEKQAVDSYLIYIWLRSENKAISADLSYMDWFDYLVDNVQNVHLTNKTRKSIYIYNPNGTFNQEIEYEKITNTILIFETNEKSLVKLSMSDTSLVGFIDSYWIE